MAVLRNERDSKKKRHALIQLLLQCTMKKIRLKSFSPKVLGILALLVTALLGVLATGHLSQKLQRPKNPLPDCLVADREKTEVLLRNHSASSLKDWKVVNLGMPKMGSTSLYEFMKCANITANHWRVSDEKGHSFIGLCMRDNARNNEVDLIDTCDHGAQAITQMDVTLSREHCVFPQIAHLDRLVHREKTLYVLIFRDMDDWQASLQSQIRSDGTSLWERMGYCTDIEKNATELFCRQVENIRQRQPENLLELDLMDAEWTSHVLSSLYGVPPNCWKHANKRKSKYWRLFGV